MIAILDRACTLKQKTDVVRLLEEEGYRVTVAPLGAQTIVGILGAAAPGLEDRLAHLPGVSRVDREVPPYALVSRIHHPEPTTIRVGGHWNGEGHRLGGELLAAEPCEQFADCARPEPVRLREGATME